MTTILEEDEPIKSQIDRHVNSIVKEALNADLLILNRLNQMMQETRNLKFEFQNHWQEGAGDFPLKPNRDHKKFRVFASTTNRGHPRKIKEVLSLIVRQIKKHPALEFVIENNRRRGPSQRFDFTFKPKQ